MITFARAKTKSIFTRLWPQNNEEDMALKKIAPQFTNKRVQKDTFLQAIKKGGIWLS